MASFHDQWMSVWEQVAALPVSGERVGLQQQLGRARDLIREENAPAEKREGGEMIRAVALRARELTEATA